MEFLTGICHDGHVPMTFLKLIPYFGTRVERELREAGRVKGQPGNLDYNFMSESLDACWSTVKDCFAEWLWGPQGVVNLAKWARNYLAVRDHFAKPDTVSDDYRIKYRETVAKSNLSLAETMTWFFDYYESGDYLRDGQKHKQQIRMDIGKRHQQYCTTLNETLKSLRIEALR